MSEKDYNLPSLEESMRNYENSPEFRRFKLRHISCATGLVIDSIERRFFTCNGLSFCSICASVALAINGSFSFGTLSAVALVISIIVYCIETAEITAMLKGIKEVSGK